VWVQRRCGFQQAHREWLTEALSRESVVREENWSEAIAVGNLNFVDRANSDRKQRIAT
jgi:hypothetical protein